MLLAVVTIFTAYVATIEDIPVPKFLLLEIQNNLKTKGVALQVKSMRITPDGRIRLKNPALMSPDLGATLFSADAAIVKINLTHLLIGQLTLDQIKVANGNLFLPAMLTPTGLAEKAIESVNFEVEVEQGSWNFQYANFSVHNLEISLAGNLKKNFILDKLPQPAATQAPVQSLTRLILDIAPKINQLQNQLNRLSSPSCIISLDTDESNRQTAELKILIEHASLTENIAAQSLIISAAFHEMTGIELNASLGTLSLPQDASVTGIVAATSWDAIPSAENVLPEKVEASIHALYYKEVELHSLVTTIRPDKQVHQLRFQTALGETPFDLQLQHNLASEETSFHLNTALAPSLLATLDPIALGRANILLTEQATLEQPIDISVSGLVDKTFKPLAIKAIAQSGPLDARGAHIDQSKAIATLVGPQITVDDIWIRSGLQSANIQIGYNLETLFRRVLVEGNVDPTMVNGWFLPWWAAIWDGMSFPAEGMYAVMDSQATFKQPDTVVVTGIGYTKNMDLRGLKNIELRTDFYALFHYVDLYNLEINTKQDRFAAGEIQFTMDRDDRDGLDKLSAMWIDMETDIDVRIGPSVIWEIADDIEEILEPYAYEIPPLIKARSSNIRHKDLYDYNVDLDIKTNHPFSYYGFPFENLTTTVHVENDIVDVPNARGTLGGGQVEVATFVHGEEIALDVTVTNANFGKTLIASNTYFAEGGSETAQEMDTQKLLDYGGTLNTHFDGIGIVGDSLSYIGGGTFHIEDADFGKFQILGILSLILESTPLGITTLAFQDAEGSFDVDKRFIRFNEVSVDGPVASLKTSGDYNIETDDLNFKARLFPFRNSKIPLISPLLNIALQPISSVLEFLINGTFSDPKVSLFKSNNNGTNSNFPEGTALPTGPKNR